MDNPSYFLHGAGIARVGNHPIPELVNDHDVVVRIAYVGVCGSDVHFWKHGGIGTKVTPESPLVMGHEASGVVSSIGSAVTSLKVGDRVAIEPGFPCRRCGACKNGVYNLCRQVKFAAAPPDTHGTLTKFFIAPEDFLYKLPECVDLQEGVLVEPLAVAVHANRLVGVKTGHCVLVIGSGTIGLLCGAVANALGADRVILIDIAEDRLEFAQSYIQCETFLATTRETAEDLSTRLLERLGIPDGVDVIIEASGAQSSVQLGIYALKLGGSYVQTGIGKAKIEFPILALSEKELLVRGCFRYGPGDYELAVKLLTKGRVHVKPLISSVTPFQHATQAWDKTGRGEGVKNLICGVQDGETYI